MNDIIENYGPWAVIAGGSEGIGLSFARQLAQAGVNLLLLARRLPVLEEARADLLADYDVEVRVHALDLTAADLDRELDTLVADLEVGLLIYNAGAQHGAGLFVEDELEKARQLIALNCHGPAVFCHRLGGAMRERGRGGIILVSSLSGFAGSAYTASYSAAKAYGINLAEGLYTEMAPAGVHVLCLVAGATDTPAMAASGLDFSAGAELGITPMQPDEVAAEGLAQLPHGPVHIAGEKNRETGALLRADREQAVQLLSLGAASLYDKPFPPGSNSE